MAELNTAICGPCLGCLVFFELVWGLGKAAKAGSVNAVCLRHVAGRCGVRLQSAKHWPIRCHARVYTSGQRDPPVSTEVKLTVSFTQGLGPAYRVQCWGWPDLWRFTAADC